MYERELCEVLIRKKEDIESHMTMTEKLTNDNKPSGKKSYLEMENGK